MFIFINGVLVVDLGGVHQRLPGQVDVDARPAWRRSSRAARWTSTGTTILPCAASARIRTRGVTVQRHRPATTATVTCNCTNDHLRLPHPHASTSASTMGRTLRDRGVRRRSSPDRVELPAHAVRVPDQTVELHAPLRRRRRDGRRGVRLRRSTATTSTDPSCGGKINDGSYGGCTTMCKYGPYCGDGVSTRPREECDHGSRDEQRRPTATRTAARRAASSRTSAATATSTRPRASSATSGRTTARRAQPCTIDCKVCVDCQ